jgi:hypothetical protein
MENFTTRSGRQVSFDFERITHGELVQCAEGKLTAEQDAAIMERVSGVSAADQNSLTQIEWRELWRAFWRATRAPLDDPKASVSESMTQ